MARRGRPPGRKAGLSIESPLHSIETDTLGKNPRVEKLAPTGTIPASSPVVSEIHVAPGSNKRKKSLLQSPAPTQQKKKSPMHSTEPEAMEAGVRPLSAEEEGHTSSRSVSPDDGASSTSAASGADELLDNEGATTLDTAASPSAAAAAAATSVATPKVLVASTPAVTTNGKGRVGRPKGSRNGTGLGALHARAARDSFLSYAAPEVDLDAISYRQMEEDIEAYSVDLDFCNSQLFLTNLTPQEARTFQLRRLDLGHQIRFCHHRKEKLEAQRRLRGGRPFGSSVGAANGARASYPAAWANGSISSKRTLVSRGGGGGVDDGSVHKRLRATPDLSGADTVSVHSSAHDNDNNDDEGGNDVEMDDDADVEMMSVADMTLMTDADGDGGGGASTQSLQRLGFWKCRLCISEKYMLAGAGRQPSAPSRWPLKDMGKLMSHYFDMHTEHDPDERCSELGDALDRNRGPFEYWLRKSRGQRLPDRSVIDAVIRELQNGRVPAMLRNLCRAAAAFPEQ